MAMLNKSFGSIRQLNYISEAYQRGKLSHAYIIEGTKQRRMEFAETVAKALLCEHAAAGKPLFQGISFTRNLAETGNQAETCDQPKAAVYKPGTANVPCGSCPSCVKAQTHNHPDIIYVTHAKESVLAVGEIREQVVDDISIKPYYGPYKIYIIDDAQLMNENAQNALLKTIEEPAGYGLILLLTDNGDSLLQTIRSRCIRLSLDALVRSETAQSLMDEDGQKVVQALEEAVRMDALSINKTAKELEGFSKEQVLMILQLWFRDVLVQKSTGTEQKLYFADQAEGIKRMARDTDYEGLNRILLSVDAAKERLKANVKAEAVYENLLIAIRREYKRQI